MVNLNVPKVANINGLLLLLTIDSEYSLLPELYDIFGKEKLVEFLDVFGGTTISVPSRDKLIKYIDMIEVYSMIEKNPNIDRYELGREFDVSVDTIVRWNEKVKSLLSKTSLNLRK